MAKYYALPGALILMTLSIDIPSIIKLGPKALIMFGTATVGIIIGGPIAVMLTSTFSPETVAGVGDEATWRGLSTLAGSWIGGGANQTAMLEAPTPSSFFALVKDAANPKKVEISTSQKNLLATTDSSGFAEIAVKCSDKESDK